MIMPLVLEGTWEEIRARADEFRGCRVRLTVLSRTPVAEQPETSPRAGVRDGAPQDYPVTPYFTTDECLVPVDLRPLAEGTIVPFVDGGQLPPRLPAELREEIDLRDVHSVSREVLDHLCQTGKRVCRIITPYREHLAQHFAVTYMRIGLPEPYETQP